MCAHRKGVLLATGLEVRRVERVGVGVDMGPRIRAPQDLDGCSLERQAQGVILISCTLDS